LSGQEVCTIEELDKIIAGLRTVAFLDKILPSDHNDLVTAVKCIRDLVTVITVPGGTTVPSVISKEIDGGKTQDIINVSGVGVVEWFMFRLMKTAGSVDDAQLAITFVIDDVTETWGLSGLNGVLGKTTKQTIGITANIYDDTNQIYALAFKIPFRFRSSCRIYIKNGAPPGNKTHLTAYIVYYLLKKGGERVKGNSK